jgi:hypothetical protein
MKTMDNGIHTTLLNWADFYLIVGSAGAALTGLQFIVQTLLASERLRAVTGDDPEGGIAAFGSPTVVHFGLVLLVSSVLCVPWTEYLGLRVTLGAIGVLALLYVTVVVGRAQRQHSYTPEAEDWLFHIILPPTAYGAILFAAVRLESNTTSSLFTLAAANLLLLTVGIHNAWDTVTYITIIALKADHGEPPPPRPHRNNPPRQLRGRKR